MSFECEHCDFKNNEIQRGGKVGEKGVRITVHVQSERDLNRQVVKSDYTSVKIVELDFEIPAQSQKGEITTVEGVIDRAISGLQQDQPLRRIEDPTTAAQIDEFLTKLLKLKSVQSPFTMVFEDISGNCFIENPCAPLKDPRTEVVRFARNVDQDHILGIYTSTEIGVQPQSDLGLLKKIEAGDFVLEDLHGEVLHFPTQCPDCGTNCQTNMKVTNIPYFKEVVIMATNCDACGHRSNEVKPGGGIGRKGIRIEVKVRSREDFSRDVLKSETCSLEVPELELSVGPYALGGRFTTVEGLLVAVKEQLTSQATMFIDSADDETKNRVSKFVAELDVLLEGNKEITLVLDDPAGNSYVQSFTPPVPDSGITIINYERTYAHNEELGLNDMKTENYETNDNQMH
ncbi:zinc finger protein ZPR1 isoform X2 [Zootermopsis nevadensis]|nr:zinc finger protein ZPR1 isoform X2 [Zootermopsis nevadensis]